MNFLVDRIITIYKYSGSYMVLAFFHALSIAVVIVKWLIPYITVLRVYYPF